MLLKRLLLKARNNIKTESPCVAGGFYVVRIKSKRICRFLAYREYSIKKDKSFLNM